MNSSQVEDKFIYNLLTKQIIQFQFIKMSMS